MKLSEFLEDYGGWLAFIIATVATLGSLYYSCPVSYTHLDVYKRQDLGSPVAPGS